VLSQGGPRDAAINFGAYRSLERHRAVLTAIDFILVLIVLLTVRHF